MKRIAVVAVGSSLGEEGGAERFYDALVTALNASGVEADLIKAPGDESSFEAIKETYLRFYDIDLSGYDGVISTKAPSYIVRHPNHICYLLHTIRVFYDMFEAEHKNPGKTLLNQREFIHKLDSAALSTPRTRKVFTIGNEVSRRLLKWNGIESEVLHPALTSDSFRAGGTYGFVFMPGRLHRWKRVDLVIKAMKYVKAPLELRIVGTGEDEDELRKLAGADSRVRFLGRVSDEQLVDLYSNALVVPFVPIREDFGYITLEAFRSEKPVITCEDSGEPAYLVKNGVTGFVCKTNPEDIAKKIQYLYDNPDEARAMGERGRSSIRDIRWENTVQKLLAHL